jgi:hypothetical protein
MKETIAMTIALARKKTPLVMKALPLNNVDPIMELVMD